MIRGGEFVFFPRFWVKAMDASIVAIDFLYIIGHYGCFIFSCDLSSCLGSYGAPKDWRFEGSRGQPIAVGGYGRLVLVVPCTFPLPFKRGLR